MFRFILYFLNCFLIIFCRYKGCEPLVLSCPSCSGSFDCPPIFGSFYGSTREKTTSSNIVKPEDIFWNSLRCPKCPIEGDMGRMSAAMITNQVASIPGLCDFALATQA